MVNGESSIKRSPDSPFTIHHSPFTIMQIDKTSFNDISIFHEEEEFSIFHKLNFTRTTGGKQWLRKFFTEPHDDLKKILGTQKVIRTLMEHVKDWPTDVTNGTVLVMDKFLDYGLDPINQHQTALNSLLYKWLHSADYSMVKYSVPHFADFYRGIKNIAGLLEDLDLPLAIKIYIDRIIQILREPALAELSETKRSEKISPRKNLYFA
ncbi:MAG TPA: hypothetical protein VI461_10780, partial [Chitinophagaceae bacterium]|nr:hypothetical protein [Chitinophagaceae bacterium]